MSESQLSQIVLKRLSKWFYIEPEVWGENEEGRKFRIDAIIRPINPSDWANEKVAFGIEFKALGASGVQEPKIIADLFRQAFEYTRVHWQGYGKIPILIAPPMSSGSKEVDFYLKRMLNSFNIGELKSAEYNGDLTIVFNESHGVWSEKRGVIDKRRKFL